MDCRIKSGTDELTGLTLRACEAFEGAFAVRDESTSVGVSVGEIWVWRSVLRAGEAMALQDVVGKRVVEHDGADLFEAAHGQLTQVPVAPAGMDAFADCAAFVLCFAGFARHPRPPGQHAVAVAAPRQIGVGAMLGLRWRTIDRDAFAMRPFDILGAVEAAVG